MAEETEKKKTGHGCAYIWGNLLAMAAVVTVLIVGVAYGLDAYTHHGESIAIPDVKYLQRAEAERQLREMGMDVVVSDTGYVKSQPADVVLEVSPAIGTNVKTGHVIRLIVNAAQSPTIAVPDLIDNCSLREAMARLQAMGFVVAQPEHIAGERDWVYGLKSNGRDLQAGERIAVGSRITVVVGNGLSDENDSIRFVHPSPYDDEGSYEGLFEEDAGGFEDE